MLGVTHLEMPFERMAEYVKAMQPCLSAAVNWWVGKRERQRQRDGKRQRQKETETKRETKRRKETERQRQSDIDRHKQRDACMSDACDDR